MLDLHQLNIFLVAAETLNFSETARRLFLSQPNVSQHIQNLEQHFGLRLFTRAGRHLDLTDAGRALMPLARDIVSHSRSIEATMLSLHGETYGHLIVGCSTTAGKYILPHLLARFLTRHPKVSVTCQAAPQEQTIRMVCDGEAHFTLASAPYTNCRDVSFARYMTDPLVLIAPQDHPWAAKQTIEPEALYDGNFIMREQGSGTATAVRDGLASIGISLERMQTLIVLGNPEAIALAVKEGLGVGFVSSIVLNELVQDDVAVIDVHGLKLERDIFIGRHARRKQTVAQKAFWEFVRNETGAPLLDSATQPLVATQRSVTR